MAPKFVQLTRADANPNGASAIVNLGNVAWIEPGDGGTSRIVFMAGLTRERADGVPLSILVRESVDEIAQLAGVVQKTDDNAIAQAWVDQSSRRGLRDENE